MPKSLKHKKRYRVGTSQKKGGNSNMLNESQFDKYQGGSIADDLSQVSRVLTQNAKNIGLNINHGAEWIRHTGKSVARKAFRNTQSFGRKGLSAIKGLGGRTVAGVDSVGNRIGSTASNTFFDVKNKLGGKKTRRTKRNGTRKKMRRKTIRKTNKH